MLYAHTLHWHRKITVPYLLPILQLIIDDREKNYTTKEIIFEHRYIDPH